MAATTLTIFEGAKETVAMQLRRLRGSGTPTVTTPERRILNASRGLIAGFDWAAAAFDTATSEISALFDSSLAALSAVGTYYMQFRLTIGTDRIADEVRVDVTEWGP
jgi:hypothetical protein